MRKLHIPFCLLVMILMGCKQTDKINTMETTAFEDSPKWAESAIWYQIFVERFHNGNPNNDPTPAFMQATFDDKIPENWKMSPWTSNWYERQDWEQSSDLQFYTTVQMRRYGGDLQGVMDKIPYLVDLGINAVYFNPINDAPSLHKYDVRNYHHVDINFGNDPEGDWKLMQSEDPANPETWVMTNADKLFFEVVKKMHENGIKVVLDFSFNHTGRAFWAFQDLIQKQAQSPYKDWYEIKSFDDPNTTSDELQYDGWFGIKHLPELKKIRLSQKVEGQSFEGNVVDPVKAHIFAVCKKYMDPNGDGNVEDGIDGMRLDVAEHVPMGFWRDFRKYVRSVNPSFYTVGECWWKQFPDHLMDPLPWVQGDVFDAVMHYHWYKPARSLFRQSDDALSLAQYCEQTVAMWKNYKVNTARSMMNLNASHDSPRFWTSMSNTNKYKFQAKNTDFAGYYTGLPSEDAFARGKALLLHQFTFIGSPHVWNGDEMGMWGSDDPDNRKPLWWPEMDMVEETNSPFASYTYMQKPQFDKGLHQYYKDLIALRKSNIVLSQGAIDFVAEYVSQGALAYIRNIEEDDVLILINPSAEKISVNLKETDRQRKIHFELGEHTLEGENINLEPFSGVVMTKD
ncbi:MAG: DUF3459 domain-containing protein [Saprospiraceae bacterium]|nr:DUF3459 domain-containing protein [Saprospiraceae bacterium]